MSGVMVKPSISLSSRNAAITRPPSSTLRAKINNNNNKKKKREESETSRGVPVETVSPRPPSLREKPTDDGLVRASFATAIRRLPFTPFDSSMERSGR